VARVPRSLDVLRERQFRLLFCGQAVSLLGDGMVNVALAFAVLDLTGSASELGIVLAARMLPLVGFLLAGGVIADRLPRREVMLAADAVRVLSQGVMAALLIGDVAKVWQLAALSAVTGSATAFFNPASVGLLPAVVSPGRLQQANALRGLAMAGGQIAGPALAGILVASAGAGWALAVDAATFAVSVAFLARLHVAEPERARRRSVLADLREGWDTFRSFTWLWAFVAAAAVGNFVSAASGVLGPLVSKESLGGAAAWALIVSALGVGSLVGGVLALHVHPRRPMLTATLALSVFALPLAMLALELPAIYIAAVELLAGIGLMISNTVWETTLQRYVPAEALSRVSSYDWFGSLAFQPLGYAIWGPVAEIAGVSTTLWVAFALQLSTVVALLLVRDIRRLTMLPVAQSI
jgi:predicted MFS family arabinose efflux permease